MKLILYLFEGIIGSETNFIKNCLFSTRMSELPEATAAKTLNCGVGLLPVTYLGVLISGRRPRRQDWEVIILKVRRRFSSWKMQHLSLGGRLTLVN